MNDELVFDYKSYIQWVGVTLINWTGGGTGERVNTHIVDSSILYKLPAQIPVSDTD